MRLDVNKLAKVPAGLNDLKTKIDNLDVGKLTTVPVDLIELGNVVSKEVIKKTVYNTLNTKVNNSEKKIPNTSTTIKSDQYNTDQRNLEKILEMLRTKSQALVV